ncbi:amidohydrolase family protein [Eggerthellaceae bacterium zg-893]|nr:amidohydrolase family protein [Eggerthellaceae bacterium zg-893]
MAIVDAHAHIYPEKIAHRAVEAVCDFYSVGMYGEGTIEHLLSCQKTAPITHFLVHSVATSPRAVESINTFIAQACSDHPEFIGFMTMHQDYEDPEREVQRAIDLGLKGAKIHPDSQHVDLDDPRLMAFYEIIEGRLPIVIHTGDYRYDHSNPVRLKKVLRAFPNLRVDAAHYGSWSRFEVGYDVLHDEAAHNDNLFIDTSSSSFMLGARRMRELARLWGTDRVMFGSDYPMWDPADEYATIAHAGFTDDELENILWHNAERFIGVSVG